ncbi:AAA domain-containing protein [Pedobacter antarcticus]|uniref:AAA domain-containing protein n=1 Tax=Pedobacter antarcticus TaxID=34086 RepID=UPI0008820C72|nr:AAA domain-containing protein [Pedobacter antarcticus]SDL75843.1 DNA helicase, putative [Pedobacter antarcticus]
MEYFNQLTALLKIEKEADQRAYMQLTASASAAERRENGLTWYPVAIRGTETGRGDYLTIEMERTTHQYISHQLRFGSSVAIFSNHNPKEDRLEGIVAHQSGNMIKISLRTDELPDWCNDGKLGVDLLFDQNSYQAMEDALKQASKEAIAGESKLIQVLTGEQKPVFHNGGNAFDSDALNASQQEAVNKILGAAQLSIIHGPPGTGKTTTLVAAIQALLNQDEGQILVVAPSNTAVDLLSEKLDAAGVKVLRIGNPARISSRLNTITLDGQLSQHSSMKLMKELRKQAAEYKKMAHKYKRNFGRAEQEQRKALFNEAAKINKEVGKTEQYMVDDLLDKNQVITATLVGAQQYMVRDRRYKTVVIDEAGQALEPACWIPILKAGKLILAGDHCQLPPTIKAQGGTASALSKTLLEKCVALHPEAVSLLEVQYRMHEQIMAYSSLSFYQNRLKAHESVAKRLIMPEEKPFQFIDTAGCGFEEKSEGSSIVNPEEAAFLIRRLTEMVLRLEEFGCSENFPSIGVISPYKEQARLLEAEVQSSLELQKYTSNITVNTVDSFQGQERDLVYISLCRSNSTGVIGFLNDTRRMNVAMTRAKMKLVMIGDSATLARSSFYADLVSFAEKHENYHSAWEF